MSKIYKVGIIVPKQFTYKINGEYRGQIIDLWNIIKKKLQEKQYKFKEIYIEGNKINWNKNIDSCKKGEYDILIGNFTISAERYKKVNFSPPIYVTLPDFILKKESFSEINQKNFILFLIKNIYKQILLMIVFAVIIGFIINKIGKGKKKNIQIFHVISGFFQQSGNMLNDYKDDNYLLAISILVGIIVIFVFFIVISALINSKTLLYENNKSFVMNNLTNKKILVKKGSLSESLLKRFKAKEILLEGDNDIYEYFIKNKKKYDGFYSDIGSYYYMKTNKLDNMLSIRIEDFTNVFAFPINKSNMKILNDINGIMYETLGREFKGKEIPYEICKKYNYINPNFCVF